MERCGRAQAERSPGAGDLELLRGGCDARPAVLAVVALGGSSRHDTPRLHRSAFPSEPRQGCEAAVLQVLRDERGERGGLGELHITSIRTLRMSV